MAGGLGSTISITEIHIIEKIGAREPVRMGELAKSIGVTLATVTVACDKLEAKGLIRRVRSAEDRRVVNIVLTAKGRAAYEYHKAFHERLCDGNALPGAGCGPGAEPGEIAGLFPAGGGRDGGRSAWIT